MKVLMTTDAVGGVFTYCLQLVAGLASRGVGCVLASMGRPLSPGEHAEATAAGAEVACGDYRLEWMDEPWDDVERAGEWLLQLERRHRPDLVHVNGFAHAALGWRAPVLLVAHSCVCTWWRAVLGESAPPRYDRYRAAVARGLGAAHAVVAPTAALLRAMSDEYGPLVRGHVVPNGIALVPGSGHAKERLVLSAGRVWDAAKNIPQLGQAAACMGWPVVVAGDVTGPDGREVSLPPGLRPLGPMPRAVLAHWMGRASIFALPARYEPFGLSILEAAAARCALVLGDIPSLRELWQDAALFVDPNDGTAIAACLKQLTRDAELRAELGARARARAQAFGVAPMVERYLDLYRSLCARPRAPLAPLEVRQ